MTYDFKTQMHLYLLFDALGLASLGYDRWKFGDRLLNCPLKAHESVLVSWKGNSVKGMREQIQGLFKTLLLLSIIL